MIMENNAKYTVGIDLGTTNCALALMELNKKGVHRPDSFEIPQIIDRNMVNPRKTLPSFCYQLTDQEIKSGVLKLPWHNNDSYTIGEYAQKQGEKSPQRLICSAKSWLCASVDRKAPILPLYARDKSDKISPVEASARFLKHIKDAWNKENKENPLEKQNLVLTVPASFDTVARELTLESAKMAQLGDIILLEEPIAAFYSWIAEHPKSWRNQIKVGDVILVCDIGGGTTDFSLIEVAEENGDLSLSRIAVGEHILLGGDNMDLALANTIRLQIETGKKKLEQWQFLGLSHSCRQAKEKLLRDMLLKEASVVIPSRGSKMIGGTLSGTLTREEMEKTILEGFFNLCEISDIPVKNKKIGLRTVGLNYAEDPSILKHLAKFLTDSKAFINKESQLTENYKNIDYIAPTSVLFNGGVCKSNLVKDRIVKAINIWLEKDHRPALKILDSEDPDLAVSRGGAYFGRVSAGKGLRIRSATVFSYYIGIESTLPAIPGLPPLLNGLCVIPVGMEEGTSFDIPDAEFGLVVGETAEFRFFMSRHRPDDILGTLVEDAYTDLENLPSLEITLPTEADENEAKNIIPVRLKSNLTDVGTLELWCKSINSDKKWKLQFNLRGEESSA